jgi:hypothetical protein
MERFEETALETATERSGEVQSAALSAAAMREIEVRVMLAKRFPRDEERCYQRLMTAMKFPKMADAASYKLPWLKDDSGKLVSGPSVHLARLAASIYGNMASGNTVVASDDQADTVRGFAWDLESNYLRFEDVQVQRYIPRKKGNATELVLANQDQRMRNAANYGGRKERNCILRMIRRDIIEDALEAAEGTKLAKIKKNPDAALKKIIKAFGELSITVEQLQAHLGHKISESSAEEIAGLREIFVAIRDGEARWSDYHKPDAATAAIDPAQVTASTDANRGHGAAPPPSEAWAPSPEWDALASQVTDLCVALERPADVAKHIGWAKSLSTRASQLGALRGSVETLAAEHRLKQEGGAPKPSPTLITKPAAKGQQPLKGDWA